ncbi:hypothetical protein Pyn_07765 [Prunus yedoensis var. nudiflora]|uniref:Uncharacterized protein n=1 Tax=Prunus yedoensis var. nudiflora TaxID=2094558 RepID=A0A314ZTI8_PRUYE|nr:hypothetical protein Pyn_07765 [Prunus yedoensis var. nudiflora]
MRIKSPASAAALATEFTAFLLFFNYLITSPPYSPVQGCMMFYQFHLGLLLELTAIFFASNGLNQIVPNVKQRARGVD